MVGLWPQQNRGGATIPSGQTPNLCGRSWDGLVCLSYVRQAEKGGGFLLSLMASYLAHLSLSFFPF